MDAKSIRHRAVEGQDICAGSPEGEGKWEGSAQNRGSSEKVALVRQKRALI